MFNNSTRDVICVIYIYWDVNRETGTQFVCTDINTAVIGRRRVVGRKIKNTILCINERKYRT